MIILVFLVLISGSVGQQTDTSECTFYVKCLARSLKQEIATLKGRLQNLEGMLYNHLKSGLRGPVSNKHFIG